MEITKAAPHAHHAARLNRLIQAALMTGLIISMTLMTLGALLYAVHGEPVSTTAVSMHSLIPGVMAGNSVAMMVLGVIILMITPAMRVVVAAIGYMLEHDWTFALVSLGVTAVLVVSMLIGNG